MHVVSRRGFLRTGLAAASATVLGSGAWRPARLQAQQPGQRPRQDSRLKVLNPRMRVPLSFIIDDSTCLVNLAHFKVPQFAEVYPDRYRQPWRKFPREIPDRFVEKFGLWCQEHGVKGKYSVVPYPACVGWIDHFLPGWTRKELYRSIRLVQELMMPNWDIHPEMVSHTWAIDTRTGRPYPYRTAAYLENTGFSVGKSAEFLAEYMAYALRILKNAGFRCQGVTTPGGFGSRVKPQLAQGTLEACRDVFATEIPHYFRDVIVDPNKSVAPQVYYASGLDGPDPRCVVSIIGCTGDWFGGWDGMLRDGSPDRFITPDLQSGRLVEVIDKGEPACLVCHWPGIYYHGQETGFKIFQEVVRRLHQRYDHLRWMTLSEIARYWAAKELTSLELEQVPGQRSGEVRINAPFACPDFTLEVPVSAGPLRVQQIVSWQRGLQELREVDDPLKLAPGRFWRGKGRLAACFHLPKGRSRLAFSPRN